MMLCRQSSAPVQARFQRLALQPGRNQEVNTRLQMKADELERLFAEHKRRAEAQEKEKEKEKESSSENNYISKATTSSSSSSSSRGELYERYMHKRDSKLRKEWGMKREAMKVLRESLERSSAELKLLNNLRYSSSTTMKRDQLVKKNISEEEEEDEQSDTSSYRSVNNSKLLPTKRTMSSSSSSSSVGRNSNYSSLNRAIPRPSAKATAATGSARPGSGSNSSDIRKENTKPSMTNFPRSKSASTGGLSSSSTPSRKLPATPLKPLTVLPKEQSGHGVREEKLKPAAVLASDIPGHPYSGKPTSTVVILRTKAQKSLDCISEAAVHDIVDVSSPTASSTASSGRTRKKWASVDTGSDASCQPPRKDTGKGIKRFLQFRRKKKLQGAESVSPAASARDEREEEEDGAAASEVIMSKSRLEYQVPCRDGFSDHGAITLEQVQTRGSSMAAASPANCKLKEDQSPRGVPARSFFSLPQFRNREGDSKLGR